MQSRQRWEPDAAPVSERLVLLKAAHEQGIYTWVSLEPVIDPDEALAVIRHAHPWVRRWKVGKLNHMKAVESKVDWKKFHADVKALLLDLGADHYIKEDLRAFV